MLNMIKLNKLPESIFWKIQEFLNSEETANLNIACTYVFDHFLKNIFKANSQEFQLKKRNFQKCNHLNLPELKLENLDFKEQIITKFILLKILENFEKNNSQKEQIYTGEFCNSTVFDFKKSISLCIGKLLEIDKIEIAIKIIKNYFLDDHNYKSENLLKVIRVYVDKDNIEEAQKIANEISQYEHIYFLALSLIIERCLENGDIKESHKISQKIVDKCQQSLSLLKVVKAYIKENKIEEAKKVIDDISHKQFKFLALLEIVKAYINQNNMEEAKKVIDDISYEGFKCFALLKIVEAYINQNNMKEAKKGIEEIINNMGDLDEDEQDKILLAIIKIYLSKKNLKEAEKIVDNMSDKEIVKYEALLQIIQEYIKEEQLDEVIKKFQKLFSCFHNPERIIVYEIEFLEKRLFACFLVNVNCYLSHIENSNICDLFKMINMISKVKKLIDQSLKLIELDEESIGFLKDQKRNISENKKNIQKEILKKIKMCFLKPFSKK